MARLAFFLAAILAVTVVVVNVEALRFSRRNQEYLRTLTTGGQFVHWPWDHSHCEDVVNRSPTDKCENYVRTGANEYLQPCCQQLAGIEDQCKCTALDMAVEYVVIDMGYEFKATKKNARQLIADCYIDTSRCSES